MSPSTRRPRRKPEQELQHAVCQFLDVALERGSAMYFAVPNGGFRSKVEASIMKGLGTKAGVADLCFVWCGKFGLVSAGFVELKAAKGKLSDAQIAFGAQCGLIGAPCIVARSVDEVEAALRRWGVPLRASSGRAVMRDTEEGREDEDSVFLRGS